ncbi:MAG: hypothetical protein ACRD0C_03090 [Acidimicrobiia bacterium]
MNVSDLLEALSQADPAGPVVIDVDHQQRPVDAVVMTDDAGATVLMTDPARDEFPLTPGVN